MNIETKFLGEVEINELDILTFEYGLPGFPLLKQFVLLPIEQDMPLALLQAVEQAEIGFIVAYPFAFKKDYAFDLSEDDKEDLQIMDTEDVVTYVIVTLKDALSTSTMNLMAPVVINIKMKLAKQIVLQASDAYPLRHPIGVMEGSAK
ncbi:flagellar assembly protein FliW [Solibacillus sp. FSL H8-0538]|uniref:flagellar assembly protein FliW n=1 Tax=Solibacillus sp. FSL H8-0538 TaxID=2921400 RepID=UPI0030F9D78C